MLAYAKGLQDWQSGGHEWHMRSSRYMNGGGAGEAVPGFGMSAASLRFTLRSETARARSHSHVPYRHVGPSILPDFDLPYTTTLSPHLEGARVRVVGWARRMGILQAQPGVPGSHIWDEDRIRAIDLPLCAAGIHPDATPDGLDLSSAWLPYTLGDVRGRLVPGGARTHQGPGGGAARERAVVAVHAAGRRRIRSR
ncbi:germacradienol/geosmin synthase [Streptomyces californicus]